MIAKQELYMSVSVGFFSPDKRYYEGAELTVLTTDDKVYEGVLTCIGEEGFTINNDIIFYSEVRNIEKTDWLDGEDIRDI